MNILLAVLSLLAVSQAAETNLAGKNFLLENQKKSDIKVLPSGLQYRVIVPGYGVWQPKLTCDVYITFEIQTLKGKTIESTQGSLDVKIKEIILPGIREALQHMVLADQWEIFIPAELGYEDSFPPGVKEGDVIKAFVQLWGILSKSRYYMKNILTCNLETKEGCTELELEYARNMYDGQHNHPQAMRGEIDRLKKELNEGKSPNEHNWWERKIFLMEQMIELEVYRLRQNEPRLEL